jgi:predicted Zn-dependent peptidase
MTSPTSTVPNLKPPFYYHRLPNGLEMLGQQMPSLGSAAFAMQVGAGSANEADEQLGLCQLLEDMLFQGTPTRNPRQITDAIELLGARRIGGTGYETARYGAQVVHTRLDQALDLWADLLLHPTFPKKEFEQLRPPLIQAIKRRDDEPMRRVGELITRTFYQGSRMGRPALGTVETVSALTIDDLKAFYAAHYRADKAVFVIAGNFDWDHVVAKVTELFGDWATGAVPSYSDKATPTTTIAVEQTPGEQEHIYFGYPSVAFGDPDYYANILLIEAFGGGMTSRLFSEVREKRGLVYAVSAYPNPSRDSGAVFIYAGTQPEKAHETASVILSELGKLAADGLSQDELDRAKVQVKSEVVMGAETAVSRVNSLLRSWWYERRVIPISDVRASIDAVTTEQLLGLLKRFPPTQTLTLAAIGPTAQDDLTRDLFPPQG